jgi:CheY-like chemotaxis protein
LTKVLIVDDEPTVCDVVGRYLHADGFQTVIAGDGAEALGLSAGVVVVNDVIAGGLVRRDRRTDLAVLPIA